MTTAKIYLHWSIRLFLALIGVATPLVAFYGFTQDPEAGNVVVAGISVAVGAVIALVFVSAYHQIEFASDFLTLRYFPVYRKTIAYTQISSCHISEQQLSPTRYGGWGPQLAAGGFALTNRKGPILHLELTTGHRYNVALWNRAECAQVQEILNAKTGMQSGPLN